MSIWTLKYVCTLSVHYTLIYVWIILCKHINNFTQRKTILTFTS